MVHPNDAAPDPDAPQQAEAGLPDWVLNPEIDEPPEVQIPSVGITCMHCVVSYEEAADGNAWLPITIGRSISHMTRCTQPTLAAGNPMAQCMYPSEHAACDFYAGSQVAPEIITRFRTTPTTSIAVIEVPIYSRDEQVNAKRTWRIWEYQDLQGDGDDPATPNPEIDHGQYVDLNAAIAALAQYPNLGSIAAPVQTVGYFEAIRS